MTVRSARAGAEAESPPAGGGSCVFEVACGTMTPSRRRGSEVRSRLPGPLGATGRAAVDGAVIMMAGGAAAAASADFGG